MLLVARSCVSETEASGPVFSVAANGRGVGRFHCAFLCFLVLNMQKRAFKYVFCVLFSFCYKLLAVV